MLLEMNFPTTKLDKADEAAFMAARVAVEPFKGPDHVEQAGVVNGKLIAGHHKGENIYPGVSRDYWTYVPAQYDGKAPANLMIFQDGASYLKQTNAAIVFDNMIAKGDLKPTICVFVEPGDLKGQPKGSKGNRSAEYDSISDAYLRFLLEELLPDALADYNITDNPRGRAICGMSSGGICAFNAAFERPDQFGVVVSHVGSFTNIRGGHVYPSRVRQNAKKHIRVFLQGGAADLNHEIGNWPIANFDMASSLTFKGYDMRFEFGPGAHNFVHAGAILPQTLKWIFRE